MFSALLRALRRKGSHLRTRHSSSPSRSLTDSPASFRDYADDAEIGGRAQRALPLAAENDDHEEDENQEVDDEDEAGEADPLLPIFSAAHLDSLPVFNLTHNIRLLIVQKCETTLSWEQLRSPQISQFLVKPIQNEIRASHFSRATLYALIANCLQFRKEGQANPAIVGVCNTRALLSELLAIRLLKDFSTTELIDVLSYDFDPLSGGPEQVNGLAGRGRFTKPQSSKISHISRTSTLEVAIRAQAKKLLSHPSVVQHLEAIWAGSIVFHSAADNLHRYPTRPHFCLDRHYGAVHSPIQDTSRPHFCEGRPPIPTAPAEAIRRSVTIYDLSNASLFKLSRLRVPRYRQLLSMFSYAVMLALFLAVLYQRSLYVTPLEVLFWFWSAGFMLDELVGFSEQGFGLYIASVWNAFDIGISTLFTLYYILRILGAIVTESYKQRMAFMAYDVLASSAVLLFPRLFSLLDHYRYFSQLLIAFRLMAQDLAAVLVLITICCSGFFVAFTMSFDQEDFDGRGVAYALFQILMGFTPAAWEVWGDFNFLGKAIMALFLIIGHFLVVTILITVLTNSFMAIVKNANEEHQYLFAVNTISSVKSDALFSYVAPTNCLGFILAPLRYLVSFPKYVLINRTVIKATHFPMLFLIFMYERLKLASLGAAPFDYREPRGRLLHRTSTLAFAGSSDPYANTPRIRMPSEATWQKDRALDEVFRQPFDAESIARKPQPSMERRKTVVDQWMNVVGDEGGASPPAEEPRSVLEQLEKSRPGLFRSKTSQALSARTRSMAPSFNSDPDDRRDFSRPGKSHRMEDSDLLAFSMDEPAEADDELNSHDDEQEQDTLQQGSDKENQGRGEIRPRTPSIKFCEPVAPSSIVRTRMLGSSPGPASSSPAVTQANNRGHNRESSTQTILFNPIRDGSAASSPPRSPPKGPPKGRRRRQSRPSTALKTIPSASHTPPTASDDLPNRPQGPRHIPGVPSRYDLLNKLTSNLDNPMPVHPSAQARRAPSYDAVALDLASDIGDNRYNDPTAGMLSSSFQTQLMRGMESIRRRNEADDYGITNRIMLARMNNLEEGFRDILKEVKEWRSAGSRGASTGEESTTAPRPNVKVKRGNKKGGRNKMVKAETVPIPTGIRSEDPVPNVPQQSCGEPVAPNSVSVGVAQNTQP